MQLWQFTLPNMTNDGAQDYFKARKEWERRAVAKAGGLTHIGLAVGQWADGGKLYHEPMQVYQIASSNNVADDLLADAFELFPDQLAIIRANIGEATIFERQKVAVAA